MVIKLESISFRYDAHLVLEKVSFHIQKGQFTSVFGPNGGGKTTLFKLLMGFLKPSEGKVEVLGGPPIFARLMIGYVPQTTVLDREFPISALEVVLMGLLKPWKRYRSRDREKCRLALSKVGLLHCENRRFGTLSGGEMQRVLMARALVGNPSILLLDEPTASIDPDATHNFYRLLEDLKSSITIVMATHDLQDVLERADRFLCVHRQVSSCSRDEICDHFAHGLYHSLPHSKRS